jgi:hypothetical protein
MLSNFTWPKPENDFDRKLIKDIIEHKCHIVGIPEGKHGPLYSFSIGLYLHYEHPEILVFGIDHQVAATAINDIRDLLERGLRFGHGDVSNEVFEGYRSAFVEVDSAFTRYYLGTAIWFYRSLSRAFPVLQLVWPDKRGKLPWELGYDSRCEARQPVLVAPGSPYESRAK